MIITKTKLLSEVNEIKSTNMGQLLTTIYLLIIGIMIPMTAFLIDKFSFRQSFLHSTKVVWTQL
jgi:hypothetical protein